MSCKLAIKARAFFGRRSRGWTAITNGAPSEPVAGSPQRCTMIFVAKSGVSDTDAKLCSRTVLFGRDFFPAVLFRFRWGLVEFRISVLRSAVRVCKALLLEVGSAGRGAWSFYGC